VNVGDLSSQSQWEKFSREKTFGNTTGAALVIKAEDNENSNPKDGRR